MNRADGCSTGGSNSSPSGGRDSSVRCSLLNKPELYPKAAHASRAVVHRITYQMSRFDLTLPTPAQNLAFDEALLEWAEESAGNDEYLRLWESPDPIVVVGRSSRVAAEVNEAF